MEKVYLQINLRPLFESIPGATSDDMVHHTIPFAEKNPKKLIAHAGTNDIYGNIDTIVKNLQLC